MPIGVRTPVDSMSMRFRIGIVQMFGMPGTRSASFISVLSDSNVTPGRHSDSGFSTTVVSTMLSGAGSVGLVARPALPNTRSTSGNPRSTRSWICRMRCASVTDIPGRAVGM